MDSCAENIFRLLRKALAVDAEINLVNVDWLGLIDLSTVQGVAAIVADGVQNMYENPGANNHLLLELDSKDFKAQKFDLFGKALACKMSNLRKYDAAEALFNTWDMNGLETIILKGRAFSSYYPIPEHRYCSDIDCFTRYKKGYVDSSTIAWQLADELTAKRGVYVDSSESKHSRYKMNGLCIENHRNLIGVNGSRHLKDLDSYLQSLLNNQDMCHIPGTKLLMPGWLFNALFCVVHAQVHFLEEEGILLKHILDWALIRTSEQAKDYMPQFKIDIERFGLTKFYLALDGVTDYVIGLKTEMTTNEQRLMDDILANKDIRIYKSKWKARLNIIRMVWTNRWKYRYFSDSSAITTLIRYFYGHLFDRN